MKSMDLRMNPVRGAQPLRVIKKRGHALATQAGLQSIVEVERAFQIFYDLVGENEVLHSLRSA